MLLDLITKSKQMGLKVNLVKSTDGITLDNNITEKVESYVYLGQKIELLNLNLKADLNRRCSLVLAVFGILSTVYKSNLPKTLKAKTFDQYVYVLTYGTDHSPQTSSYGTKNVLHEAQRPHI